MNAINMLLTSLMSITFLQGCDDYFASHPAQQKGLIYCTSSKPNTFNPQLADGGLLPDTLSSQLFDRLLQFDEKTYLPIPMLATKWQVRNKGKEYLFTLREEVNFHHTRYFIPTRPLNAEDVVFSFSRLIDEKNPFHNLLERNYPWFESFRFKELVAKIEAVDKNQVLFTLHYPDASFLSILATRYAVIHSAEYAKQLNESDKKEWIDTRPIGTGAYKLKHYQPNQFIRLKKHNNNWAKESTLEQIVYDISYQDAQDLSKLITNECDIIANLGAYQLKTLKADPNFQLIPQPALNIAYLSLNTKHPFLSKFRVRQAIGFAINKEEILKNIYHNAGKVASSILPPSSWAHDGKAANTYDPKLAKSLLAQAGLVQGFDIDLLVTRTPRPYNSNPLEMAKQIKADLAKVNIRVNILINDDMNYSLWKDNMLGLGMILEGWVADNSDPDNFLRPNLSCSGIPTGLNSSNWCNTHFDRLLNNAIQTRNRIDRKTLYVKLQQLVREKLPIIPLVHGINFKVIKSDLNNFKLTPFGDKSFAEVTRNQ